MIFSYASLNADLAQLRRDADADRRFVGDNLALEENVGPARQAAFEALFADDRKPGDPRPDLYEGLTTYFFESVQGDKWTHVPSCFTPANDRALLKSIEPTQKILTLECIHDAVREISNSEDSNDLYFTKLSNAVNARKPSLKETLPLTDPLVEKLADMYKGARPAFACFKAEVEQDLTQKDWLPRLRRRLGLRHYGKSGADYPQRFALMEYTVQDVLDALAERIPAPFAAAFARPTTLDSRDNPCFLPAPPSGGDMTVAEGFAVNLDPASREPIVREILRARIAYRPQHVVKIGQLTAPSPAADLGAARAAHLVRLQNRFALPGYGAILSASAAAEPAVLRIDEGTPAP